jgi:hypothetical protein
MSYSLGGKRNGQNQLDTDDIVLKMREGEDILMFPRRLGLVERQTCPSFQN